MTQTIDMGHWTLAESVEFDPDAFGFVYRMTTPEGKIYIGKKNMVKTIKRKPLKGKKRRRICQMESDWRTYTSSSNLINEDISKNAKDNYKFEILQMVYSKFEAAYVETKYQFDYDVLFNRQYLNGIVNCRLGTVPKELQERFDNNEFLPRTKEK